MPQTSLQTTEPTAFPLRPSHPFRYPLGPITVEFKPRIVLSQEELLAEAAQLQAKATFLEDVGADTWTSTQAMEWLKCTQDAATRRHQASNYTLYVAGTL